MIQPISTVMAPCKAQTRQCSCGLQLLVPDTTAALYTGRSYDKHHRHCRSSCRSYKGYGCQGDTAAADACSEVTSKLESCCLPLESTPGDAGMAAAVLTGPVTWQAGWECITIGAEEACNHHMSCLPYMYSLRPRVSTTQRILVSSRESEPSPCKLLCR